VYLRLLTAAGAGERTWPARFSAKGGRSLQPAKMTAFRGGVGWYTPGAAGPGVLAPSAVLPEKVPAPLSAAAACLTSFERTRTAPVRASTNERYARERPSATSSTIVSNAARTPCVYVGNATRRER
jgi:hypothetical protein